MFGGPSAEEMEVQRQMANAQVTSSFIQFVVFVGLVTLAPYVIEAVTGESVH